MTLAYLLKKFPRLSETFVLNEILGQEALGRELHVFSRRPVDDEPRHAGVARLRAVPETLPSRSSLDPWNELFGDDGIDLVDAARSVSRELREFGVPRVGAVMAEALFLRRRSRELGIRHVHVHFATESAQVAYALRGLGGPTYSLTAHAKDIYRSTVDARLLSALCTSAAFVVTVCDANVAHLQSILEPEALANVRRLYNGVDLDAFEFQPAGRESGHVLGVGRLVEKKGFDVLVDAIAELRSRGREVRATIVGEGDQREALERRIQERGLVGPVVLRGPQSQEQVRDLMSQATLLCLPCRIGEDGNRDALPTVLLESLACGLPCISTPVTGVPEILGDEDTGLLVPQDDVAATTTALERLLEDAELRGTLAQRGRLHAAARFDGREIAETLGTWFDEVAAEVPC